MLNKLSQKYKGHYARFLIYLVIGIFPFALIGQTEGNIFLQGNDFYQKGNYAQALKKYKALDSLGYSSGELFYNMGNVYYKLNQIGKSIYYYEKARLVYGEGNDEDVENNLLLSSAKSVDKIESIPSSFFAMILEGFLNFFSLTLLAWLMGIFIWVFCGFFILEIKKILPLHRTTRLILRTIFFTFMVFWAIVFTLKSIQSTLEDKAIVIEKTISAKSEPSENSKSVFVVHEGLKVEIKRKQEDWIEIRLSDGNKGWVMRKTLGVL